MKASGTTSKNIQKISIIPPLGALVVHNFIHQTF